MGLFLTLTVIFGIRALWKEWCRVDNEKHAQEMREALERNPSDPNFIP